MAVNVFTLNDMNDSSFAIPLYETMGAYVFNYILSDDHDVDEKTEDNAYFLLKRCNEYAESQNMKDLCEIYDVFGLEQDAMIIYQTIADHLLNG